MEQEPAAAIRPSAIAGTWYPGEPAALRATVQGYLAEATLLSMKRVFALVCPHAGYRFSGPTAALAYRQLEGRSVRRVVILGPLHRPVWGSPLGSYNVPGEAAFRTPLGDVPIDHDFVAELGQQVRLVRVRGDEEHSLEIQLPFLQVVLDAFKIVPVMVADDMADADAMERLQALAQALAGLWDEQTVVVCSTDLSHLHDYEEVRRTDEYLVRLLGAFDVDGLAEALRSGRAQACGAVGLVTALHTARAVGATRVQVLGYTTSGDVTGDRQRGAYTVGYVAAAVGA